MDSSTIEEVTEKVVIVVQRNLDHYGEVQTFPVEKDLADLGLDSIKAINLLLDLEQTFDIIFSENLLTAETFRTVITLRDTVQSLIHD